MSNRRTDRGYKLRVHVDALKEAKAMTNDQWIERWATKAGPNDSFISRGQWVAYLETCIIRDTEVFLKEAA